MKRLISFTLLAAATAAAAQTTVSDAWVRGTVAQQTTTGLFATLTSKGGGTLIEASSPVAGVVEIHEMSMHGDVMKMRALSNGLPLPAGKAVKLEPGGYHIMLMGLKKPLAPGERVPVVLIIESADKKRETLNVQAEVRALGAAAVKAHKP